jgi:hypothetical protein
MTPERPFIGRSAWSLRPDDGLQAGSVLILTSVAIAAKTAPTVGYANFHILDPMRR